MEDHVVLSADEHRTEMRKALLDLILDNDPKTLSVALTQLIIGINKATNVNRIDRYIRDFEFVSENVPEYSKETTYLDIIDESTRTSTINGEKQV